MSVAKVTDGREELTVHAPTPSSLAALERLGWAVVPEETPAKKPSHRKSSKSPEPQEG